MYPETVIKNIENIAEYGRYDDMLVLFNTPSVLRLLTASLEKLNASLTIKCELRQQRSMLCRK